MEPTRLFPIIVLFSLVTVEYGGWALLGFLTGRGALGGFRERFFAAGHAHAGVLLVLSLAYFVYLGRTGYSVGVQWLVGALLLVGVLGSSTAPPAAPSSRSLTARTRELSPATRCSE